MKFTFLKGWLLTLGFMSMYSSSHAQNTPFSIPNFDEDQITYNEFGSMQFAGVTIDPNLKDYLLDRSTEDKTIVFTFKTPEAAVAARKIMPQMGADFVGPDFIEMPIQGAEVNAEELLAMTALEGIYGIWENQPMTTELEQAIVVSSVSDTWEDSEFTTLNHGMPLSGRGVGVLINDSGFDGMDTDIQTSEEGDFTARLVQNVKGGIGVSVEDSGDDNDQGGGHGSHCMGIVGGDGRHSDGKYTGVAPGSYLIGYGSGAGISILDVAGGFEYVKAHKDDYNIRAMSNSYGTTSDTTFMAYDPSNSTNLSTKILADAGVVVVFSAGNSGGPVGKITGRYKTAPWVVCVGNGLKSGTLASSSSRGRPDPNEEFPSMRETITVDGTQYLWENRPTVTAPGSDIVSVRATAGAGAGVGDVGLSTTEIPYYTIKSGTSMACPHVAGIVALLMEANPNLEWRAVKAILQRTAIDNMGGEIFERGAGYVNAWAAAAAAFNGLCNVSEDATYEEKYGLPADGSFGFDDDPWKTCELHPEVFERIKASVPNPNGEELLCNPTEPVTTDATGDTPAPSQDIVEVRMFNETETDFQVSMEVAGNLGGAQGSSTSTAEVRYSVRFTLSKDDGVSSPVTYLATAIQTGVLPDFELRLSRADSPDRGSTNAVNIQDLEGSFDLLNNTITWTIPKALLNANNNPVTSADPVTFSGPGAQKDNRLTGWKGIVRQNGALSLVANIDDTAGGCFRVLEQ